MSEPQPLTFEASLAALVEQQVQKALEGREPQIAAVRRNAEGTPYFSSAAYTAAERFALDQLKGMPVNDEGRCELGQAFRSAVVRCVMDPGPYRDDLKQFVADLAREVMESGDFGIETELTPRDADAVRSVVRAELAAEFRTKADRLDRLASTETTTPESERKL